MVMRPSFLHDFRDARQRANITHFVGNMDLPSEDSDAERHYRKGSKQAPVEDDAWDTKSQALGRTCWGLCDLGRSLLVVRCNMWTATWARTLCESLCTDTNLCERVLLCRSRFCLVMTGAFARMVAARAAESESVNVPTGPVVKHPPGHVPEVRGRGCDVNGSVWYPTKPRWDVEWNRDLHFFTAGFLMCPTLGGAHTLTLFEKPSRRPFTVTFPPSF